MTDSQRRILESTLRNYLSDKHPQHVQEFEAVFGTVIEFLSNTDHDDASLSGEPPDTDGCIGFDADTAQAAIVSVTCCAGFTLLKAALKDSAQRDLPRVLDHVEAVLVEKIGHPKLVHDLRERIQGIAQQF